MLASMRLVAIADTHLYHRPLQVPEGDVLIHAGDMCRRGSLDELSLAADWLRAMPHRHKIVVAGNHDWAFALHPDEARALFDGGGVEYLEDAGATIDGVRFWGSPWQPAFHGWAFNLARGPELAAKWALIPEGLDVLITHGPPAGIGDHSAMTGRTGCADLRARVAVVRPRVHLFGHIHEDGGAWPLDGTCFVNCTTWESDRAPTVIDLDADGSVRVDAPPPGRPR